jgi:heat shock protein HtpX
MNNQIKTILLLGALSAVLIGLGGVVGGGRFLPVFLTIAVIMNFVSYFWSDKIVLKMSHAKEVSVAEAPRLHALVEELAVRANIPKPRVYLIPENQPNAFATGRNPQNGAVAVTAGIMQLLSERELRGVLAHELAHIRNRDILIASVAATVASAVTMIANMLQWGAIFGMGRSDDDEGGSPLGALALAIVAPIAATLIQLGISRSREFIADQGGAEISGDPEALASALEKLHRTAQRIPAHVQPATASMFIVNPFAFAGSGMMKLFSTHPPVEERVSKLRGMMLSVQYA